MDRSEQARQEKFLSQKLFGILYSSNVYAVSLVINRQLDSDVRQMGMGQGVQ